MRRSRAPRVRPATGALLAALAVVVAVVVPLLARAGAVHAASASSPGPTASGEPVAPGVVRQTRRYGPYGEENTYDVYLPAGQPVRPRPTVLFVHGGSWEIGDKAEYAAEAVEVAQRGWTAVSVSYRRTPTAPWPAQLVDVRAALGSLQASARELGVDPYRTGALGDSAGGQLAALLGRPTPGLVPVRAVVTWSGLNDLPGLLQQRSAGGCAASPCRLSGLARKAVVALMRCAPAACPRAWRAASPAAGLVTGPATYAVDSETELVDPRQAWVMDAALARAHVASRVRVLPGSVHGRGYQRLVWADSLRFLAAALTPETAPAFPRPRVAVTLSGARSGAGVRLTGTVRPRALGSSVALQRCDARGRWHTARLVPLTAGRAGTGFLVRVPLQRAAWRVQWRGGGGLGTSPVVRVGAS